MAGSDAMVNREVGSRLRQLRRARGLALSDVEARSRGELRASVVGAYERGERTLSVSRLLGLAAVYEVDAVEIVGDVVLGDVVPYDAVPDEIDLVAEAARDEAAAVPTAGTTRGVTVDLERLEELMRSERALRPIVHTFVREVARRRKEAPVGGKVTVRAGDLHVLALSLGMSPEQLLQRALGQSAGTRGAQEAATRP
jgi:transcriptional regulator with XRE-family HTH domain